MSCEERSSQRERGTWIVNSSFIYAGEADRAEILYRAELCNRRADVQATSGDTLKKNVTDRDLVPQQPSPNVSNW